MTRSEERFREALGHYNAGRGAVARRIGREIADADPGFGPVQGLLGLMALREQDHDEAAHRFALAAKAEPTVPAHRLNLGIALLSARRWQEATESLAAATSAFPHQADLWSALGNAHAGQRDWARAERAFARAAEADPSDPGYRYNRALALDRGGRHADAAEHYEAALRLAPDHADARNNLGLLRFREGRLGDAAAAFALVAQRGHPGGTINLARTLAAAGRVEEAAGLAREAASRFPDVADAHHYLGEVLDRTGDRTGALDGYRRALEVDPEHRPARAALLHAARFQGAMDLVERHERQAIAEALEDAARGERPALTPFMAMACPLSPEEDAAIARATAAALAPGVEARAPLWRSRADRPARGDRLRIGYLTNDVRDQATAHLAVGLFENHDRDRFEITVFSHGPATADDHRRRIAASVDALVEVGHLDHDATAIEIARRGIDVLVDLKGHTLDNRLAVFARRPAPVQVTWLGFPGTTGARWMNVLIADAVVAPPEIARTFSERTELVEGCYQVNDNRAPIAAAPTRASLGLPESAMVYACFNEAWKIDRASFALWCEVLAAVEDSVLWLLDGGPGLAANLRAEAARRGVDPARLVFAPRLPKTAHLARLGLADLFLDTLTVNAHTTATDALWAGLPLVTATGGRFASRVATSLLRAAGLDDLACADPAACRELAISLGRDRSRRDALRHRMPAVRRSRLFDSRETTRSIEGLFERVAGAITAP